MLNIIKGSIFPLQCFVNVYHLSNLSFLAKTYFGQKVIIWFLFFLAKTASSENLISIIFIAPSFAWFCWLLRLWLLFPLFFLVIILVNKRFFLLILLLYSFLSFVLFFIVLFIVLLFMVINPFTSPFSCICFYCFILSSLFGFIFINLSLFSLFYLVVFIVVFVVILAFWEIPNHLFCGIRRQRVL